MKKILAMLMVAVLSISLCGCMSTKSTTPQIPTVTEPASADEVAYTSYANTLRGLCEYMADKGYVYDLPEATGDELKDPVKMDASFIGADEGYKFTYMFGDKTITVELYSFSKTDGEYYQQAKAEGKVTIATDIKNGTVNAVVSDSGKYMMMYSDAGNRADREAKIVEDFKTFYK